MDELTSATRRGVLRAGAWSAPVIVLATAAPAFAASGEAAITAVVMDTTDDDGTMPVRIVFTNSNTRPSGAIQLFVEFALSQVVPVRSIASQTPTEISPGWVYTGTGGTDTVRTFGLRLESGIPGAPTSSSTSTSVLDFKIVVAGPTASPSSGTIRVDAGIPLGSGTFTPAEGSWD